MSNNFLFIKVEKINLIDDKIIATVIKLNPVSRKTIIDVKLMKNAKFWTMFSFFIIIMYNMKIAKLMITT